jgi:hypothetical protein
MQTSPTGVDYIDAINGTADDPSIAINIPLGNGSLHLWNILRRLLRDNPALKSRVNLARLAAAAGGEVVAALFDRIWEAVRYRTHAWRNGNGRASFHGQT